MYRVCVLSVVGLALAICTPATAGPPPPNPEVLLLKAEAGTDAGRDGTPSQAVLKIGTCTITDTGELTENKHLVDVAKFAGESTLGGSCGSYIASEGTKTVEVSTGEELTFKGNLRYRTSSPVCVYTTETYAGDFAIPGLVEALVSSRGELVASESEKSGCEPTVTVEGDAQLKDSYFDPAKVFYAQRKGERDEE